MITRELSLNVKNFIIKKRVEYFIGAHAPEREKGRDGEEES